MWRKLLFTSDDGLLTFIRMALFLVFFPHGAQKTLGWFGGPGLLGTFEYFSGMGIPGFLAFLAISAEFAGSIALLIGALSRVAAFGIACVMVVAVTTTHWQTGFFMNWTGANNGEGFEYHLLALALLLAVIVRGGGAWSLDRALWIGSVRREKQEFGLRQSA